MYDTDNLINNFSTMLKIEKIDILLQEALNKDFIDIKEAWDYIDINLNGDFEAIEKAKKALQNNGEIIMNFSGADIIIRA